MFTCTRGDIDHTKTKVKSPQTNGICERFHKTILQEFYQITLRKKVYQSIEELQADLDEWLHHYNTPIGDCLAITCRHRKELIRAKCVAAERRSRP